MLVCRPDLAVIYIKGLSTHIVQMTLVTKTSLWKESSILATYMLR